MNVPSVFAGVAIMVFAIPINGVVAGIGRKYQLEQMKNKDKRVKLMNEILGGVKVLKLYGWEPSFIKQVLNESMGHVICLCSILSNSDKSDTNLTQFQQTKFNEIYQKIKDTILQKYKNH